MPAIRQRLILIGLMFVAACVASASIADTPAPRGELFENVVKVLGQRFHDERLRSEVLPELAGRFRLEATSSTSLDEEREVITRMLSEIPASHLGLLSSASHQQMTRSLAGTPSPTFGFELARLEEGYFVVGVYEQGAADLAGIKRGDRLVLIDGTPPERSLRLDWRSDDAALPDPPMHALLAGENDEAVFEIERRPGEFMTITVRASVDSAYEAAKRSARVEVINGRQIAYIHFWFIHLRGMDRLLDQLIKGEFKGAEAMVLDLRGRGGSAEMVIRVLRVLAGRYSQWRKPIVALIDGNTRSAKEMLAYELRNRNLAVLVGEKTAGALLPATFEDVGSGSVLMYPAFSLGRYNDLIEGKGVEPHVAAQSPVPFSAGADPIRDTGFMKAYDLAKERARLLQPI